MTLSLSLSLSLSLCSCSRGRCLGGIVVLDMMCVALLADMFFCVIWMDESLMSNEEVASGECFGTNIANEGLFFGMCTNVTLQMFLAQLS